MHWMSLQIDVTNRWGAPDWIAPFYDFTIWFVTYIGNVTGLGYQAANLLIFVLLQPLLMLLFMLLWLRERKRGSRDIKEGGIVRKKMAIGVFAILAIAGLVMYQSYDRGYEMEFTSRFGQPDWVDPVYDLGVAIMQQVGDLTGLGYYAANLLLFILVQPALIILFFLLWRRSCGVPKQN